MLTVRVLLFETHISVAILLFMKNRIESDTV